MSNEEHNAPDIGADDLTPDPERALKEEARARAERIALLGAAPLPPEPPLESRLAAIKAAKSPLFEAAQPLLRALADMPTALDPAEVTLLHRVLEREVRTFESLCGNAMVHREHVLAASYALCTALDEAASNTVWGGGQGSDTGVWASKQLAAQFHGDTKGGDKIFLLIGRVASRPQEYIDLIEVLFTILALGFEGRYRNAPRGQHELDTIRHQLYTLLAAAHGDVPRELSPHWRGVGAKPLDRLFAVPVWVIACLAGLVLLAMFAWYKYRLTVMTDDVVRQIHAIGQLRRPPPPPVKPLHLRELLADEIARGTVSVDEAGARSAVSFKGDDMFVPGQARLSARIDPVLVKVADEIKQVGGTVQITGHSDNQPIRTREFPDNQVLSEKRAAAVAAVLQARGVPTARLQADGKGDTQPVADNATAAGRAKNRRVDVVVTQGARLPSTPSIFPSVAP